MQRNTRQNNRRRKRAPRRNQGTEDPELKATGPSKRAEVCRIRSLVAADTTVVTLSYTEPQITTLNAGGGQWAMYTWRANDAWDPDPAIGSGSISGFTEWASLYNHWRVLECSFHSTLINPTTVDIFAYWVWSVTSPPITSLASAINGSEMPRATKIHALARAGQYGSKASWKSRCDLGQLYGNKREYIARNEFAGFGTTAPNSPLSRLYISLVAFSPTAWSTTLDHVVRFYYTIEFFGRNPVLM